jgi:deoxyribodipyrimidine photolyase-related protein
VSERGRGPAPAVRARVEAVRHLVVVLGDQLDAKSAAFDGFDPACDLVWMAEVTRESEHVWSHPARIAVFLAAMRHFRNDLRARGWPVDYTELAASTLGTELGRAVATLGPRRVIVVEPGEWRVQEELRAAVPDLEIRPNRHFLCSREEFATHAAGRRQLRMEFFYRPLRRRLGILMEDGGPAGGVWNFDSENRGRFGAQGPGTLRPPRAFPPDAVTREVLDLVAERFPQHPGSLAQFDWPVTPAAAEDALADFIEHRLPLFGRYQDAMWTEEPWLYHSRLSAALNLALLDPRRVLAAAEEAYTAGHAPLEAVEGFVRQILGWREYVRGVYWQEMPGYLERNALGATLPLPGFYWTGDTEMACLRAVIGQTLEVGYAHHIQRLMVTGLYALLLGVDPRAVHEWYLAVYVDAVEWVELPNVLGMSQYADGGLLASKPYIASGRYIERMSNYCRGCPYDPGRATGETACPFTTLYWDFLGRHAPLLRRNPRMQMQLRNLERIGGAERAEIAERAASVRALATS